jgi:hypothetical protein
MRSNITNAIFDLVEKGHVPLPITTLLWVWIYKNVENLIWQLSALEIFFLFREKDVTFDKDEADPGIPNDKKHLRHKKDSVYSNESAKGNITWEMILYNKARELRYKRQHVDEMYKVTPIKLEFKFYKNHSSLLSLKSILDLNAAEIVELYSQKMAGLFKKNFWGYVFIDAGINPVFASILKMARYSKPGARGKLKGYKASENPKLTLESNKGAYTLLRMMLKNGIKENEKDKTETAKKKVVVRRKKVPVSV